MVLRTLLAGKFHQLCNKPFIGLLVCSFFLPDLQILMDVKDALMGLLLITPTIWCSLDKQLNFLGFFSYFYNRTQIPDAIS